MKRFGFLFLGILLFQILSSQENNRKNSNLNKPDNFAEKPVLNPLGFYSNAFPLSDIKITDGPFKHACDLNVKVLLQYDMDRLLAPYLKEAGIPEKAKSFPNWDGLDGHVGGHYLSALAIHYAATGNTECKSRMEYMLKELMVCQEANGKKYPDWGVGYLGGVPNSAALWPLIKSSEINIIWKYWVPWYNVHKMYSGLRDAWIFAGNKDARDMFIKFCDWGINITAGLSNEQMEQMLGNEHGGMNEIYADAYQITGQPKYLDAAKRFSHKMLLEPMSVRNDNLDNKHANTQVPKAVGFQRIAELSNDPQYTKAARFFWETVTKNRTVAFGGNSRREFFPSIASCEDFINDVEGPESCNSYNMLKLTEHIFRVEPHAKYTDYYERTIFNHILSTQHPEHGGYVYFTPIRPQHYRVYSAPNKAMWCCVGSGMENHGKYGQFIYTHANDSLFVNLFIPSVLNWKEKGIIIKQETQFPYEEKTVITITGEKSKFPLLVRQPWWVKENSIKIKVNGVETAYKKLPTSYLLINKTWKNGDKIEISLPMETTIEFLPNVSNYIAILKGPILLGTKNGNEDLAGLVAGEHRWGHIAGGKRLPVDKASIIIHNNVSEIGEKLIPLKNNPLHFTLRDVKLVNAETIELEPFSNIHDNRYTIYFMALTPNGYQGYLDSLSKVEESKLEIQKRTVDFVATGEQQPEADHFMESKNSNAGNHYNEFWRDARNDGFFSYKMATKGENNLTLVVRYWGAEWGSRKFEIYIDDEILITENNTNRWNQSKFKDVEYKIPQNMVLNKDYIRVKFKAIEGNTAGAVYYIRLIKN